MQMGICTVTHQFANHYTNNCFYLRKAEVRSKKIRRVHLYRGIQKQGSGERGELLAEKAVPTRRSAPKTVNCQSTCW